MLTTSEDELRRRGRAGDPSRSRRNFERHLLLAGPLLDYFREMRELTRARVAVVETGSRDKLVDRVTEALTSLPPDRPDSLRLLEHMAGWLHSYPLTTRN